MKTYEEFKAVVQESEGRKQKLHDTIEENESLVNDLNEKYNAAVLADKDKEADKLFNEIEKAKGTIKNSKRKLSVLDQQSTNKNIDDAAEKFFREAQDEERRIQKEVNKKLEEVADAKEVLFAKLREVGEIQKQDGPLLRKMGEALEHAPAIKERLTINLDGYGYYNSRGSAVSNSYIEGISTIEMRNKIDEGKSAQ